MLEDKLRKTISGDRGVIVTDENVAPLHLETVKNRVEAAGIKVDTFVVKAGEESKSGDTYLRLMSFLAQIPLTRTDCLIALGGGVVGDLTGFAAATYLRGIKVVQIPTTLLAAVDSSLGGKTAINIPEGKNLVGAFHMPALVWQNSAFLDTLPEDVFRDGMAEVIKYGVIASAQLMEKLEDIGFVRSHMDEVIDQCVKIKSDIVSRDALDTGERQLLNLGHTVGHAIEAVSDFKVSHGSAVAKGMAYIAFVAAKKGICSEETRDIICRIIETWGFDVRREMEGQLEYDVERIRGIILGDKKRKGNYIDLVVPERIGKCRLERVAVEKIGDYI